MNAFEKYLPRSQHGRQVTLFLGLCREAGIPALDLPRRRSMQNNIGLDTRHSPLTSNQNKLRVTSSARHSEKYHDLIEIKEHIDSESSKQILGITLEDAAHLTQEEFREIWNAMDTLIISRPKRRKIYVASVINGDANYSNPEY